MANRAFNNCVLHNGTVTLQDFVNGSGVIELTGKDKSMVTDDHVIHNIRLNILYNGTFKMFGDHRDLATNPATGVFGGEHVFYLDNTEVCRFKGTVEAEYNDKDRTTEIKIIGEVEDG